MATLPSSWSEKVQSRKDFGRFLVRSSRLHLSKNSHQSVVSTIVDTCLFSPNFYCQD